ncbi:8339_t:CDS:2 [Acaulospora morrowiae]|uniref:8339_t:CDS:1 n=1 Tax=Acaulospora morrowiae TaxID=94023 RepID=A0A9N8YT56_9GLOM|nr:8339_t:CDS:2 [Acaulospora morrowiae]
MYNLTGLLDTFGIYEHSPLTHILIFILFAAFPAYYFLFGTKLPSTPQDDEDDIVSSGGFIPFLRKLHAKQGAIVSTKLPFKNTISVVDPAIIKATLPIGDRPKDLFKFLEPLIGEDNFQIFDTERAASFKRLVSAALGHDVLTAKYEEIRNIGVEFINRWENIVNSQDGALIRMQEQCLEFSLRITTTTLLSNDTPQDMDFKAFQNAYDTVLNGLFDRQFGVLNEKREEEFEVAITYFNNTLKKLIDERKSVDVERKNTDTKDNHVKDFLDTLVSENNPETGVPYSDEMIRYFMNGYLTAGYHTTGVAIPWTIFSLTQNPDVQNKLQEEIDQCLQGRLPSLKDLSNMDYLTQVIKEALRVHPPGSFCARLIKSPANIPTSFDSREELHIASDTTIIYPIPLYHENPNYFANPLNFDPSRFSRENIKSIKSNAWCPFGFGVRSCPGERMAMIDMKMMVCMIMQKFRVELGMKVEDVVKEEKFVVMPKNDILVKLIPRNIEREGEDEYFYIMHPHNCTLENDYLNWLEILDTINYVRFSHIKFSSHRLPTKTTKDFVASNMFLSLRLQSRRFRSRFTPRCYSSLNTTPEIDDDCLPKCPKWSVNSLLSPPDSKSNGENVSPEITEEMFKNLLRLSGLRLSNNTTSNDEQAKLIKDINILCNFVSHIKNVDVSGVKSLRNLWPDSVGIELREDEIDDGDKKLEGEGTTRSEGNGGTPRGEIGKGRDLLRHAKILYRDFYIVNSKGGGN